MGNIARSLTSILAQTLGEKYCSMPAGIYVFTGEDVTIAFKGKRKLGPPWVLRGIKS